MIAPQFLTLALEQTIGIRDPEARRRAMREWLQDQGFSIAAIKDSDAAIRSAISFEGGFEPKAAPQTKAQAASHSKEAQPRSETSSGKATVQSKDTNSKQKYNPSLKQLSGRDRKRKGHKRKTVDETPPRRLRWAILTVLCAVLGLCITPLFLTSPNLGDELPETLQIIAIISGVVALIALVFTMSASSGLGRLRSAMFALVALPIWSLVVLIAEAPRWSDQLLPPIALSEQGFSIYSDVWATLRGGESLGQEVFYMQRFSDEDANNGYCGTWKFWWGRSLDLSVCEVVETEAIIRISQWCDEPGAGGRSEIVTDGMVAMLRIPIDGRSRDVWSEGAQWEPNLFFDQPVSDFSELARRLAMEDGIVMKTANDGDNKFYTYKSTNRYDLIESLERHGCSREGIAGLVRPVRPIRN